MKQSPHLRIAIVAAACLLPASVPATASAQRSCESLHQRITELLLEKSCREHHDCVAVQLPQPYGCNQPVNMRAAALIEEEKSLLHETCGPALFQCRQSIRKISCENSVCVVKPSLPRPDAASNATVDRHGR